VDEYGFQALVIQRLDALDDRMERVENTVVLARIDIATLKVKAGMWGALAGMIPGAIVAVGVFVGAGPG
jgi:hypothetical protein